MHNDCPGGGFLLPSSRVPGGWFWMKLVPKDNWCFIGAQLGAELNDSLDRENAEFVAL